MAATEIATATGETIEGKITVGMITGGATTTEGGTMTAATTGGGTDSDEGPPPRPAARPLPAAGSLWRKKAVGYTQLRYFCVIASWQSLPDGESGRIAMASHPVRPAVPPHGPLLQMHALHDDSGP